MGSSREVMTGFGEEAYRAVVDSITVDKDGGLTFRFVGGTDVDCTLPKPAKARGNYVPALSAFSSYLLLPLNDHPNAVSLRRLIKRPAQCDDAQDYREHSEAKHN